MAMANKERIYSFQCGWEVLFDSAWEAVPACKGWSQHWKPGPADKPTGIITASVPFGMSYGEKIYIQITESPPGTSWLDISSTANFGLIDFGKNSRNINKLIAGVESALAGKGVNATASIQQAPPSSFCPKCGAGLTAETRFCGKCGSPA